MHDLHLSEPDVERFWAHTIRSGPDDCWLWTGSGTGKMRHASMSVGGRVRYASHVALTIDGRPRPAAPSDHALHGDCANPRCVNPAHLRWGTNAENVADKVRLGRTVGFPGEAHAGSKLTEDDVRFIRASTETVRALAAKFGVSFGLISHVRNRRSWAHAP